MQNKRMMIYRNHYISYDMLRDKFYGDPFKLYVDYHEQSGRMTKDQIKIDLEKMSNAIVNGKNYWIGTHELILSAKHPRHTDDGWDGHLEIYKIDDMDTTNEPVVVAPMDWVYKLLPCEEFDIRYINLYAGSPITDDAVYHKLLLLTEGGTQPEPIKQFLFDSIPWVKNNAEAWFSNRYPEILKKAKLNENKQYVFIFECFKACYDMFKDQICSRFIPTPYRGKHDV